MPYSTPGAAVSRCLLVLALMLAVAASSMTSPAVGAKRDARWVVSKASGTKHVAKSARTGGRKALRGSLLGINAGGPLFAGTPEAAAGRVAGLSAIGARVVRFDASWGGVEPIAPLPGQQPVRRFAGLDARVAGAVRGGLRPLLVLAYGTPWATPGGELFTTPRDPDTFAAFARAVAQRYAPTSSFWGAHGLAAPAGGVLYEIWNEPNAELFLRGQETAAARYAPLLLRAQRAIRAVDPGARISSGGLVPIGAARFLAELLQVEPALRTEIRAVGWHPYERSAEGVVRITRYLRRDLERLGMGDVPLDITEFGWSEAEIAEPARSVQLEKAIEGLRETDLGVGLLLPYVAIDGPGPGSYGLWRVTGEATASVAAFDRAARRLTRR